MIEKIVGKRIQQCRKSKGLTQEQLAEMIEVSPHHMSALERGVYSIRLETLVRILNCLGCSADEVFCDVVEKAYAVRSGQLSDRLKELPAEEQRKIFDVVDTMIKSVQR